MNIYYFCYSYMNDMKYEFKIQRFSSVYIKSLDADLLLELVPLSNCHHST